ncbi:carbohydrate ABC transporter permease [Desertihabitans brevis]|uniref:Carbohydrate ABC transporter permease n=1 Tax=Desertihabitans brevis TaxID=2268447 RepID=A0A367YW98_9ACTN|nr:carbohydrate ABC transporter permease [Desertihabitans brevis]RCK70176.1 carbohydrate ABC transporter permease [Desertihabitans brevis]
MTVLEKQTALPAAPGAEQGRGYRRRARRLSGWSFVRVLFMLALVVVFATPLLWMINSSLRTEAAIAADPLGLAGPRLELDNYAVAGEAVAPFFLNSVKLAVLNVVGVLLIGALAGYAFARMQFPGKGVLFAVVLATAIVPGIVYLIPQYALFQQLGWIDTHLPLWVPRVLTPVFATFLLRQAFLGLPRELEDAARIDGAGTLQIFFRVMIPQVKPALAAVGIFTFIESWNDLFGPLIFLNSTSLQTLPVALALFRGEFFTTVSTLMAASTLTVAPVLVVYLFAQRYIVEGITSSGVKG